MRCEGRVSGKMEVRACAPAFILPFPLLTIYPFLITSFPVVFSPRISLTKLFPHELNGDCAMRSTMKKYLTPFLTAIPACHMQQNLIAQEQRAAKKAARKNFRREDAPRTLQRRMGIHDGAESDVGFNTRRPPMERPLADTSLDAIEKRQARRVAVLSRLKRLTGATVGGGSVEL